MLQTDQVEKDTRVLSSFKRCDQCKLIEDLEGAKTMAMEEIEVEGLYLVGLVFPSFVNHALPV